MSRSIHTTYSGYARERRWLDRSRERRAARLREMRQELSKKRRIKRAVHRVRRSESAPDLPVLDPDALPIEVEDAGPYAHWPASPEDIRAVLRRMPGGALDGLAGIFLDLGLEFMEEDLGAEERREEERDPWLGRIGGEILPGIFVGHYLGRYQPRSGRIRLHACVYDPESADWRQWECFLRLRMLATLMHELAHLEDFRVRRGRGRWRADDEDKNEAHADRRAAVWVRDVAVPWLREAYPEDTAALEAWVVANAGAPIPLDLLVGCWRWDGDGRAVLDRYSGGAGLAFSSLVLDLARNHDPFVSRLQFVKELHLGELYPEARRVLAGLLEQHPGHLEARCQSADIAWHEQDFERAEAEASAVLAEDRTFRDAWRVLADVLESRADWARLLDVAGEAIARCGGERDVRTLREQRARAALELGREAALEEELAALERSVPRAVAAAAALRGLHLLRRGRYQEAWNVVERAHRPTAWTRAVIAAVRFEAAHRLGLPGQAGRLTPATLRTLRSLNLGEWADRLETGLGAGRVY